MGGGENILKERGGGSNESHGHNFEDVHTLLLLKCSKFVHFIQYYRRSDKNRVINRLCMSSAVPVCMHL